MFPELAGIHVHRYLMDAAGMIRTVTARYQTAPDTLDDRSRAVAPRQLLEFACQ